MNFPTSQKRELAPNARIAHALCQFGLSGQVLCFFTFPLLALDGWHNW